MHGTVKWYRPKKNGYGYGLIVPQDGSNDVYFRWDNVKEDTLEPHLRPGEAVEFELGIQNPRGPAAVNVRRLRERKGDL